MGKASILLLVNCLSKYADLLSLSHYAMEIASRFSDNVIKLHGFPKSIVFNRELNFNIQCWNEFIPILYLHLSNSI